MHNLMTLVFWTGVWIAVPLASMLMGNLWRPINPWTGPVRIVRTLLGRTGSIGLARLGHWPAVAGYAGFVWFQMVSLYPDDPAVLAKVALTYWAVILVLAVLEGEDWLEQGEFLTVLFGFIAKVAPFWLEIDGPRARLMRGWPGTQVLAMPPLSPSAVVFVSLALAALTFDGLMETFWWQALIGENPLQPTGRSAVMFENTVGLISVWVTTLGLILGAILLGRRVGGGFATGPVMLSFLAIAAGYHAAHYLVMLLTAGQYTLAALNDPLFTGESWPAALLRVLRLPDRSPRDAPDLRRAIRRDPWRAPSGGGPWAEAGRAGGTRHCPSADDRADGRLYRSGPVASVHGPHRMTARPKPKARKEAATVERRT
jgi:hypothetical protein